MIETYGQRYEISWKAYDKKMQVGDMGTLTVKVTKPRIAEYKDRNGRVQSVPMNIRAQAQQTADGHLKKNYPAYAHALAQVLHIRPIGEEE